MSKEELRDALYELHQPGVIESAPQPGGPMWHLWAERQTVLNLRAGLHKRRTSHAPPPPPPPALRLVRSPLQAHIRIHPENLRALTG